MSTETLRTSSTLHVKLNAPGRQLSKVFQMDTSPLNNCTLQKLNVTHGMLKLGAKNCRKQNSWGVVKPKHTSNHIHHL